MDPAFERIAWSMEAIGLCLWPPRQVDPPECRCDRRPWMIGTRRRGRNTPPVCRRDREGRMADRTKLIAGNWKMNGLRADGVTLAREPGAAGESGEGRRALHCELLICPPASSALAGGRNHRGQRHRARRPGLPRSAQRRLHRRHQRRDVGRFRLQLMSSSGIPSAATGTARATLNPRQAGRGAGAPD